MTAQKALCTVRQAMDALNTPAYLREAIAHMQNCDEANTIYTVSVKFQVSEAELQTEYNAVLSAMHDRTSSAYRAVERHLAA